MGLEERLFYFDCFTVYEFPVDRVDCLIELGQRFSLSRLKGTQKDYTEYFEYLPVNR